jgi:hypothetical protein
VVLYVFDEVENVPTGVPRASHPKPPLGIGQWWLEKVDARLGERLVCVVNVIDAKRHMIDPNRIGEQISIPGDGLISVSLEHVEICLISRCYLRVGVGILFTLG